MSNKLDCRRKENKNKLSCRKNTAKKSRKSAQPKKITKKWLDSQPQLYPSYSNWEAYKNGLGPNKWHYPNIKTSNKIPLKSRKTLKCKNDPTRTYKGDEPSPKGRGWCAHAEKVGIKKQGRDKAMWIVKEVKNGSKRWIKFARGPNE